VEPDPVALGQQALFVGGTAGNNTIRILPTTVTNQLEVMLASSSDSFDQDFAGAFSRIVVYGGQGNNQIAIDSRIMVNAMIFGGSGDNILSGGGGNNVLVGGPGANLLTGGTGRNVLIAGLGASRVYAAPPGAQVGTAGGSIVIGGSTNYDHNEQALLAILQEWGSSDGYTTRVSKLRSYLNASTIQQSTAVDQLFASSGWDWFWDPARRDQIVGIQTINQPSVQIN
jgi:Ca2+-binding RTX toxin-like protein